MSQLSGTREHVIATYRARARRYDALCGLADFVRLPLTAWRRTTVQALRLRPGDTVVDIGCGTGLNFPLLEQAVGPDGRIVGVDLTDAMLARARRRVEGQGWSNVMLVQADAADFQFAAGVSGVLSTLALSLVPECAGVVARGSAALAPGGRLAVLDLSIPPNAPRWLARGYLAVNRPFAVTDELVARRPWEAIRAAMQAHLTDGSWTDLLFGYLFLAAGTRAVRRSSTGA